MDGARILTLRALPGERHQVGNPDEAIVYALQSPEGSNELGFATWLASSTGGQITSLTELSRRSLRSPADYLRA